MFILTWPKPGLNTAYWGPKIKVGPPQPALNVDIDAHTKEESINFSFDTAETYIGRYLFGIGD